MTGETMAEGRGSLDTLNCVSKTTTTLGIISQKREDKLKRSRKKSIKIKADISKSENSSRINELKAFWGERQLICELIRKQEEK